MGFLVSGCLLRGEMCKLLSDRCYFNFFPILREACYMIPSVEPIRVDGKVPVSESRGGKQGPTSIGLSMRRQNFEGCHTGSASIAASCFFPSVNRK